MTCPAQFDDEKLISGSTDAQIKIWDVNTRECTANLNGHEARIRCLKYDDRRIVSGSVVRLQRVFLLRYQFIGGSSLLHLTTQDTTIKLWDINTHQCMRTLRGHTKYV